MNNHTIYKGDPLKDSELSPERRCCAIPKSNIQNVEYNTSYRVLHVHRSSTLLHTMSWKLY